MFRITETKRFDDDGIIRLWREAFGDSREDIEFFLDYCENKSLLCCYNDNNELCSMMFLVDATIDNVRYKYIYAASSLLKYRNTGLMSKLLEFAQNNYHHLVLIPADEHLVNFYKKRMFCQMRSIDNIVFYESEDVIEFLLEGCELTTPFALEYTGG